MSPPGPLLWAEFDALGDFRLLVRLLASIAKGSRQRRNCRRKFDKSPRLPAEMSHKTTSS